MPYELKNETDEYRAQREQLRQAEIELKERREQVAEMRRQLATETPVEDYAFLELAAGTESPHRVRLSELFEDPARPLVLMHFMFGGKQEHPCPMCTLWADGYDGVVGHLEQRVNFAVAISGDLGGFREYAASRGWRNLRVVSAEETSFKRDFGMEAGNGSPLSGVSVFTLAEDRGVQHFYTGGAMMGDGHYRGMDLLSPVWNFLDLTPQGREDWMPRVSYD